MPGAEQQDDAGYEFLAGDLAAALLSLQQLRGEVVGRRAPAPLEQALEVVGRGQERAVGRIEFGTGERHRVEQAAAAALALEEGLVVFLGDAQQVADPDHRQAKGELVDQVHVTARGDAVCRLVDDGLDAPSAVPAPPSAGDEAAAAAHAEDGALNLRQAARPGPTGTR